MEYVLAAGLVVIALGGVALSALQLPGNWLILLGAAGYDWYFDWGRIGWKWLLALCGVAAAAEVFEFLAAGLMVKKAGASKRASWGALVGGFLGMLIFSIPIPVVGTILGGLLGCFAGALIGEMTVREDIAAGTRVGVFAAIGRLLGLLLKLSAGFAIAGATVGKAIIGM